MKTVLPLCISTVLLLIAAQGQDSSSNLDAAASTGRSLQQVLSGQLILAGNVSSVYKGYSEVTITAVAERLPPFFASAAAVYCNLVSQQAVDTWQAFLRDNHGWSGGLPSDSVQAVTALLGQATLINATQQQLVYLHNNGSVNDTVFELSCPASGDTAGLLPVFLAQMPMQSSQPGEWAVIAQGAYAAAPLQAALPNVDVYPLLGPMGGGTEVVLEGDHFPADLQCRFGNASLVYVVKASVADAQSASCTSPEWFADNNTRVNFSATTSGRDFLPAVEFAYYLDPQVSQVAPLSGPRYGSFELTVQLAESVCSFADEVDDFYPIIYLEGVLNNGTDLALPANLTSDRRALLATTPLYGEPLLAGNHSVLVSLNGQQLSAKLAAKESAVVELEGPVVYMVTDYIIVNHSQVTVEARLEGFSSLPVTADIALSQRHLRGEETSTEPVLHATLSQTYVEWGSFHQGVKEVTVQLESAQIEQLQAGAIVITLVNATNADVDEKRSFSIATQLPREELTVSFSLQPDQVFYRNEPVTIPVTAHSSALAVPASIAYDLKLTSGSFGSWLPKLRQKGSLHWDIPAGDLLQISIPVNWSNVPSEAEYHVQAHITYLWNAAMSEDAVITMAHVFGVRPGECPPGTFRPETVAVTPAAAPAQSLDDNARLSALIVKGRNGTVFDLSPIFHPDVSQYGAMVGASCKNVTLCFDTLIADATPEVFDSDDSPLAELYAYPATAEADEDSSANDTAVNIAGMQSMTSNVTAGDADAICKHNAFLLPLQLGQNSFSVIVTAPDPSEQDSARSGNVGEVLDTGNRTKVYDLSVVRLADPQHAQLAFVNVTDSTKTVYTVCAAQDSLMPLSSDSEQDTGSEAVNSSEAAAVPQCSPDTVLAVNVSSETKWVSLQPGLAHPEVAGIRVEVKGQVLSQGGDVTADQIADTSGRTNSSRNNTEFLPAALVIGLQPGVPLLVPIVVVAEDGVTSQRYYVAVTRNRSEASGPASAAPAESVPAIGLGALVMEQPDANADVVPSPELQQSMPPGWPLPPAQEPWCSICPAGWASSTVDATECTMCKPGYFAEDPKSPACLPCPEGTYSSSWGSSQCSHCITGTYSPSKGSQLCSMCGKNTTNLEDGSSSCPVAFIAGSSPSYRYAVIVSFGVLLNGTALDDIASKAGVNASSQQVLEWLVKADTASAFNISFEDVSVTGVQQVERRILYVNVTATLGVDLAPGATPDEVEAAMDLTSLSADEPIGLLSNDADKFFGRTTKALDVTAEADAQATVSENRPAHPRHGAALKWPGIVGLICGSLILLYVLARFWRRRSRRIMSWLGLSRFAAFTSFTSARDTGNGSSSAELGVVSPPAGPGPLTARHTKRVSRLPDLAAEPMFGVSHEASHLPEGAPFFKPRI